MLHLLEELTRDDLGALAAGALAVLPVGATEQHGPHLPVGTDHFLVTHIARAAAEAAGLLPVVVAPTLPFGSSHHHLPFGGTLSLGTETYYRALADLAETLILSGFRRIFILNGHGGNSELIQLVARDLALKHDAHVGAAPYWMIAWESLVGAGAHEGAGLPGHAGRFETALMLALRPELVREPRPQREAPEGTGARGYLPYRAERHGAWRRIDGYTDSPAHADAATGSPSRRRWPSSPKRETRHDAAKPPSRDGKGASPQVVLHERAGLLASAVAAVALLCCPGVHRAAPGSWPRRSAGGPAPAPQGSCQPRGAPPRGRAPRGA